MGTITCHVFIACSMDGFIARPNGDLDWLMKQPVGDEDHGFGPFIRSVDGLLMGKNTFEKVLSFNGEWPYEKPVIVMGRNYEDENIPDHLKEKVSFSQLTPQEVLERLAEIGWKRVYVDGGKLLQSFLNEGLIEDMHVSRMPILIGQGIPLFGALEDDLDLELTSCKSFPSGVVESKYRVIYPGLEAPDD